MPPSATFLPHTRRGFTAIEALIAAAILAVITAAVSGALFAGRQQARAAEDTVYASMLARALLDEATRVPIGGNYFGPSYNETNRTQFDDADDYLNYTDGPNNIRDIAGNLYAAEYQPFKRNVSVTTISYAPVGWGKTLNGLLISVTVSRNDRPLVTLERIVCP